jgi:pSer/pThr/pTyr-binding forkhead associated (FHA) protein
VLLRLIPDRSTGREVVIHTSGALIGRNPAAEVVVDDAAASWEHARIVERHGSASVMDLGSSNGTFVNDELVESSLLISGDRLRVGDTVFRVVV